MNLALYEFLNLYFFKNITDNLFDIFFYQLFLLSIKNATKFCFFMLLREMSNKYLKIINQIENIRKKNNKNWMDVLRIAFKHSPKEAAKVMNSIQR